jgi:5,10-methenyltetrahydromethanopterin hydrogenase
MDEVPTRKHAEAHLKALLDGDMDTATRDFVPDMRDQLQDIAEKLPQPTEEAEIEKLEMEDDHAIVQIRYSNERESVALRSRWEEHGGRPMIVDVSEAD